MKVPRDFGGGADGVDLAVRCGIVCGGDGVGALADDLAVAHDDRAERPALAGDDILRGQRDGAAQELRVGLAGHGKDFNSWECKDKFSMAHGRAEFARTCGNRARDQQSVAENGSRSQAAWCFSSTSRKRASQAGCAGHAGPVTRLPSTTASVIVDSDEGSAGELDLGRAGGIGS